MGTDDGLSLALVIVPEAGTEPEQAERLVRRLRGELAELDVESVGWAPGEAAPEGAKGADPLTLGAIVVALSASGGVFTALIDTVRDWLGRQQGRHRVAVTIDGDTIELERASPDQQRDLVEAYLRRHSTR
ncbi:effector-associated constant component EACC1 [Sphaerisporangium perillae]|uniref:effector-associated constant component EACC1 n=1 Tax=Sphaerisporangium perillae TaxID=2935860 RepID=UPI00200E2543|nr:hypothetical protein [Sphaerisporangium perillae]